MTTYPEVRAVLLYYFRSLSAYRAHHTPPFRPYTGTTQQGPTPMDIDAFRRGKGKGKKGRGKGRKGLGKKGYINYSDTLDDSEDIAYYTKGRGKPKGRRDQEPNSWLLKGKAKGTFQSPKGKGRGTGRKGSSPYCASCNRIGHTVDQCYAKAYGKGLHYYDDDGGYYDQTYDDQDYDDTYDEYWDPHEDYYYEETWPEWSYTDPDI